MVYGYFRSVAMDTAILIGMGYSAEEAMDLLERQRREADPQAWHIRRQIKRFEKFKFWKTGRSQVRPKGIEK